MRSVIRRSILGAVLPALAALAGAQTAPAPSPAANAASPAAVVQLNPFEVQTSHDTSYGALNSTSITRFNVRLDQLPVSADVFTQQFIQDAAATSVEDLIEKYGIGAGYVGSSPDSVAVTSQPGDRNGNAWITLRGLNTPSVHRDGFAAVGSLTNPGSTGVGVTSTFDTERVEVVRGPQALLYGGGGAGGVINTVSKPARFNEPGGTGEVQLQVDQYGTRTAQLDENVGGNKLAVRVAVLNQRQRFRRVYDQWEANGDYVQVAYRPTVATTIRIYGEQTFNRRTIPSGLSLSAAAATVNGVKLPADPRNGQKLTYLFFTGRTGATDPTTGAAYPGGAILNGSLTWDNLNSWGSWWNSEAVLNEIVGAVAETRWNHWLSSQVAFLYNNYKSDRVFAGTTLAPPGGYASSSITDRWSLGLTPTDTEQPWRARALRFSLLAQGKFFNDRADSQTIVGGDAAHYTSGPMAYNYYVADSNFNVVEDPTKVTTSEPYGRTGLGKQWWAVGASPVLETIFAPGSKQVSINGVNYVRMLQNPVNPALTSPQNPLGVSVLGGGQYSEQQIRMRGLYAVNYTDWLDGRLQTLLGVRFDHSVLKSQTNQAAPAPPYLDIESTTKNFNLGVNYRLADWLRAYYGGSASYDPPLISATDPFGNLPKTATGIGNELGFKFSGANAGISGSLAYYWVTSRNEQYNIAGAYEDAINPKNALNGPWNPTGLGRNSWVPVNRTSSGVELVLTAQPTRHWRLRFAAAETDGRIGNTVRYPQVYNDQFYADASGNVTYADGTPFLVPVNTSALSGIKAGTNPANLKNPGGMEPLTITMMSTPGNPYFVNPSTVAGTIDQSTAAALALKNFVSPGHGAAVTGQTGLPISDIQINTALAGVSIPGTITVVQSGDKTVGYPRYKLTLTSLYSFTGGWLKGVSAGGTVNTGLQNRGYYFYPAGAAIGAPRDLFSWPSLTAVDAIVSYTHKFRRCTWTTQLNVNNLFNHYTPILLPSALTGYLTNGSNANSLNATFWGQPRLFVWTNTLRF